VQKTLRYAAWLSTYASVHNKTYLLALYCCPLCRELFYCLTERWNITYLISSRNLGVFKLMASNGSSQQWWPRFNMSDPSSVSIAEYTEWYDHYGSMVGPKFTHCSLEEEMNKVCVRYKKNSLQTSKPASQWSPEKMPSGDTIKAKIKATLGR